VAGEESGEGGVGGRAVRQMEASVVGGMARQPRERHLLW